MGREVLHVEVVIPWSSVLLVNFPILAADAAKIADVAASKCVRKKFCTVNLRRSFQAE